MFDSLNEKLTLVFKKLKGHGKLSEENIKDVLRDIRLALLEADVNFKVVKEFVDVLRQQILGQEVLESLTPAQQVVKIVHRELTTLLGGEKAGLLLTGPYPVPLMFVGLQGSGKTTTVGKLARYLKQQHHRPLLIPVDISRPAAVEQLRQIGESLHIPVHVPRPGDRPVDICLQAVTQARDGKHDVLLIDTAGRWHIDDVLMAELREIKHKVNPREILLVADAMTGQEAVNIALKFDELLDVSGVILTKMDGDARGGAALSIKKVINKPIKFIGTGEKMDDLELFYPDRMSSRILGMGDLLTLIEKAEATLDERKAREMEKKLQKGGFTLEDFLDQLQQVRKMGALEQLLSLIPGFNAKAIKGLNIDGKELVKIEAIINSMTREERRSYKIINGSRRKRIASGSGTSVQDVNRLLKNFAQTKKMMENMTGKGLSNLSSLFQ